MLQYYAGLHGKYRTARAADTIKDYINYHGSAWHSFDGDISAVLRDLDE